MGLVTTLWDRHVSRGASSPACIPGDPLSFGVLGCSAVGRLAVCTKFGINTVTSQEWGTARLLKEGGVSVSLRVSPQSIDFYFVPFSWAFPFLCLLTTTILDYFFLF